MINKSTPKPERKPLKKLLLSLFLISFTTQAMLTDNEVDNLDAQDTQATQALYFKVPHELFDNFQKKKCPHDPDSAKAVHCIEDLLLGSDYTHLKITENKRDYTLVVVSLFGKKSNIQLLRKRKLVSEIEVMSEYAAFQKITNVAAKRYKEIHLRPLWAFLIKAGALVAGISAMISPILLAATLCPGN